MRRARLDVPASRLEVRTPIAVSAFAAAGDDDAFVQSPARHHGLGHGHGVRDVVVVEQLPGPHAQQRAVHGGHALQGPAARPGLHGLVDLRAAQQHPADDLLRVGAELLVVVGAAPAHDLKRWLVALLGLEEDLDSPGAGPSACAHSETRPR